FHGPAAPRLPGSPGRTSCVFLPPSEIPPSKRISPRWEGKPRPVVGAVVGGPVGAGLSHEAGYTAQAAAHPRGGVHGSGHDGAGCHDRERRPSVLATRASPLARGPGMGG